MSDPINNPPSYYLLPDGTEIREMIRQARGDESTIEHLAQSIMEYAGRLGKKPGASRADDFRKIARCAVQGANVCEGRSVSDNGDPPTEPKRPSITLPVVFGGERVPASGVYLTLDSRGCQMANGWTGGYTAPSTMIGPLPSERDWPTRFGGEREIEEA